MKPVTVIETAPFIRHADGLLTAEERAALIDHIARNPEAGTIIQGTGGARKLRWARAGAGKSGGVRTIYYYHDPTAPLVLLTVYGKGTKASLSAQEKLAVASAIERLKSSFRNR
ncbi:MAG: addiction module toxin RelE [Elstera sp.]